MELLDKFIIPFFGILIAYTVGKKIVSEYKNRNFAITVWGRFNLLMFAEVIGLLLFVMLIVIILYTTIPFLRYGWLNLVINGGGNIAITPIDRVSSSPNFLVRILPPFFFIAFLISMLFFVKKRRMNSVAGTKNGEPLLDSQYILA